MLEHNNNSNEEVRSGLPDFLVTDPARLVPNDALAVAIVFFCCSSWVIFVCAPAVRGLHIPSV